MSILISIYKQIGCDIILSVLAGYRYLQKNKIIFY